MWILRNSQKDRQTDRRTILEFYLIKKKPTEPEKNPHLIATLSANVANIFPQHGTGNEAGHVVFQRMTAITRFPFAIVFAKLTATTSKERHVLESLTPADARRDAGRTTGRRTLTITGSGGGGRSGSVGGRRSRRIRGSRANERRRRNGESRNRSRRRPRKIDVVSHKISFVKYG